MSDEDFDFGSDINRNWNFDNGDLVLSENTDNISQAIVNRLNTPRGNLDLFYLDYGSDIIKYLGWKNEKKTLDFIKMEVESAIRNDNRINRFNVDVEYGGDGVVNIKILLYVNEDDAVEIDLELSEDGITEVG